MAPPAGSIWSASTTDLADAATRRPSRRRFSSDIHQHQHGRDPARDAQRRFGQEPAILRDDDAEGGQEQAASPAVASPARAAREGRQGCGRHHGRPVLGDDIADIAPRRARAAAPCRSWRAGTPASPQEQQRLVGDQEPASNSPSSAAGRPGAALRQQHDKGRRSRAAWPRRSARTLRTRPRRLRGPPGPVEELERPGQRSADLLLREDHVALHRCCSAHNYAVSDFCRVACGTFNRT